MAVYRRDFRPSEQLPAPYVIAGINVLAADTEAEALEQLQVIRRSRIAHFFGRGRTLTDAEADAVMASPQGRQLQEMMRYTVAGTPAQAVEYLDAFAAHAVADELMVAHQGPSVEARLRSARLLAEASELTRPEPDLCAPALSTATYTRWLARPRATPYGSGSAMWRPSTVAASSGTTCTSTRWS